MDIEKLELVSEVDQRDGMAKGGNDQYLRVGRNALENILHNIDLTDKDPEDFKAILDYACGYGRVLRWLKAAFPDSYLLGVDTDKRAIDSANKILGTETRMLDPSLSDTFGRQFDLIWVGSLFTHLDLLEFKRVLSFLKAHLSEDGLLVFTAHGQFVRDRLAQRTKTYNLSAEAADALVRSFDGGSYGFSPYDNLKNYGISVSPPSVIGRALGEAGLHQISFEPRGWAQHQDVYGCTNS